MFVKAAVFHVEPRHYATESIRGSPLQKQLHQCTDVGITSTAVFVSSAKLEPTGLAIGNRKL